MPATPRVIRAHVSTSAADTWLSGCATRPRPSGRPPTTVRTERTARNYWIAVGGVLAAQAALLAWNAWHFDWLRGYDAYANDQYAATLADEHRLPSADDSGVWHTPPLWFALVGVLRRAARSSTVGARHSARASFSRRRQGSRYACSSSCSRASSGPSGAPLHLLALVFAAASPALVRASAMYHPETLAVALARGRSAHRSPCPAHALDDLVEPGCRCPARSRGTYTGVGASGARRRRAGGLPRRVEPPQVDAAWRSSSRPRSSSSAPWLVNEQLAHGSALAFNRAGAAGIDPGPPPRELLSRAARAARSRTSRDTNVPERARPASLCGLVGRLGADLGQSASPGSGPASPLECRLRARETGGHRPRPLGARARGHRCPRASGDRATLDGARAAAAHRARRRRRVHPVRGAVPVDRRRHHQGDISAHGASRGERRAWIRRRRAASPRPAVAPS